MAKNLLSGKVKTSGGGRLKSAIKQGRLRRGVPGVSVGFYKSSVYPDGTPVTSVAAWNEFGTKMRGRQHVPARPFFRIANQKTIPKVRQYLKSRTNPKQLAVTLQMAGQVGNIAKNEVQKSIRLLDTPENAKITQDGGWYRTPYGQLIYIKGKKGTDNPLIDTGFMRQSVTYEVLKSGK